MILAWEMRYEDMFDRRVRNVEIFQDTAELIMESQQLQHALAESLNQQKLYLEKDSVGTDVIERKYEKTAVVVSKKRSFEAAASYARERRNFTCNCRKTVD